MEVPRGMEPTGTNGRTRHTLSDPPWGLGLVLWWFSRWMARNAVSCGRNDDAGKAFDLLASVVRFPDRHDRNRSCGWFRCRPIRVVGRSEWFCGGHGPGETPGPFPNPEAKAWHGDGTALERVWESSAPPHSTVWTFWSSPPGGFPEGPFFIFPLGVPGALRPAGTPIFYAFFRCSLPVACGRLPFHNTPRITWSASVTVINDVMRLTRYVRAGSRESRYDGKRHKPDD